jgi:hypothetical protein
VWQDAGVSTAAAIEHYLRTGNHDPYFFDWSGDIIERERRAHDDLKRALVDEVSRRAVDRRPSAEMPTIDLAAFTRGKVEPMVRGLFPPAEHEVMLRVLERSVVFLTPDRSRASCSTAHGSTPRGTSRTSTSAASTPSSSPTTRRGSSDSARRPPASCRSTTSPRRIGLSTSSCTRRRTCSTTASAPRWACPRRGEWLLEIAFQKREAFAYGCEAFSRVVERCPKIKDRPAMIEEYAHTFTPSDEHVDHDELVDILREAARVRNGWKHILARCAPRRVRRSARSARGMEPAVAWRSNNAEPSA